MPDCRILVDDTLGDGGADGRVEGGAFVAGGWRPDGGALVYDFEASPSGWYALTLRGIDEAGVDEHDFAELFTGPDGSFSDGNVDHFMLLKIAGDIHPGYAGRMKIELGEEYSSDEVGDWSEERDWSAGDTHTLTVAWDGGTATLDVDGTRALSVDTSRYGPLAYESLRLPNDGSYNRDPRLDGVVYEHVTICGGGGETDGDADTDGDGGTDGSTDTDGGGTDSGGSADAGVDGGADTGPGASGLVLVSFSVWPDPVYVGERWEVTWDLTGDADTLDFCVARDGSGQRTCTALPPASTGARVDTDGLAPGAWSATLQATGADGSELAGPLALTVLDPETKDGCGCAAGPGVTGPVLALALVVATLGTVRRVGPGGRS